jgi:hypothetical protein
MRKEHVVRATQVACRLDGAERAATQAYAVLVVLLGIIEGPVTQPVTMR